MEDNNTKPKNRFQGVGKWLLNVAIITVAVYALETFLRKMDWDTWKDFSAKMDTADHSIFSFAVKMSPLGLLKDYSSNYKRFRYAAHFNKWSAPFNMTKACIAAEKRVFKPPPPSLLDNMKDLVNQFNGEEDQDDDSTRIPNLLNERGMPVYKIDQSLYYKEPDYIKNGCSFDLNSSPLNLSSSDRSIFEWLLAIPDSFMDWIAGIWRNKDRTANWPGRIFLLFSLFFAIGNTKSVDSTGKEISLSSMVLGFIGRFLLVMFIFGLILLFIGGVMWLVLLIGNGAYALTSFVTGLSICGPIIKVFLSEGREHLSFEGKHKLTEGVKTGFFKGFIKKPK